MNIQNTETKKKLYEIKKKLKQSHTSNQVSDEFVFHNSNSWRKKLNIALRILNKTYFQAKILSLTKLSTK